MSSITKVIEKSIKELGYSSKRMLSGAGHDAKYVNNLGSNALMKANKLVEYREHINNRPKLLTSSSSA
ncbi:hypothetical protein HBHAL_2403 [Halobacillus halophilus DSM 2266]|uniref:Uncharacterized protein n=1 Tax=Halobacillus halophilus (strain ATCC 35676 / DSM 2266 / JCM 20832 / KCTC 3685 / LMG 17431 / NBRC 102448 / NCIMB 2269) TaxID=866895 RepID=I0JKS8_HALH3|nr:hypothetical protein [Halobacillus halophilus]CCG44748.1 hypothetical protein HBHAL_2403 [Halobacillus halophilus DSM 2266]